MADGDGRQTVISRKGTLIAVDGADGAAVTRMARQIAARKRRPRPTISRWDASGIFDELDAGPSARDGRLSVRTLLLLYAADLAFRLRWEIEPVLEEGRVAIAAPYVETAAAVGRVAGLDREWINGVFAFAVPADERLQVRARPSAGVRSGFVDFVSRRMPQAHDRAAKRVFVDRTRATFDGTAARRRS
jgi:thymidylate kinase